MDTSHNKSVINTKSLAASLILLLLSCLLAGGIVAAILRQTQQAQQERQQAQTLLNETRARLARAHDDKREIQAKIARYQETLRQGRTQPERRLDWVETLRGIREERRLLGLDYEINPQHPLDDKHPAAGGYDFLASTMKLDIPLLHEGDLLGFLEDLSARVQALVSVRQCALQRLPADTSQPQVATLKASCEIDWITLREKT